MAVEGQLQGDKNPSMEKPQDEKEPERKKDSPPAEAPAWGTWEELLLAHAVNRYGTKSWDFISTELRKRSSAPILLSPHHCKQKYKELKRRFSESDDDEEDGGGGGSDDATTTAIPWLDELRKLRVAELQRQLQNYDLSIASLQMKVKRLTEESEKKSDLGQETDEIEIKNEGEDKDDKNNRETKTEPPEPVSGDLPPRGSEESDRDDNQSVNGSNGNLETGAEKSENENEASPVRTGEEKPETGALSPVREDDSCNIRPDDRTGKEGVKAEPDGEASQSPESMAESKSVEGGATKENSDVQSSASRSRKERSDMVRRGSSRGDARENDDPSKDSIPVRSLPLVDFLQKVQKLGSAVFERRLDRQEKLRYKNLIRQHIDFEILQTRLKEGWYSDGNDKFFRDLLLLVNNTRVFFAKNSPESVAASELRQLVLKEMMAKRKPKTDSKVTEKQSSLKPTTLPSKRGSEPPDSLLLKPNLTGPMIVCRKRSSITAKASGSSSGAERRKEQTELKNLDKLSGENQVTVKRARDVSPLISKKNGKNVRAVNISEAHSSQEQGKASPSETSDTKSDKKKKRPTEAEEKKQSAAKFLNRMKKSSSSSNNEPSLNTLKGGVGSENDSGSGRGAGGEQKRGGGGGNNKGGDGKKDQPPKRNSGGRQPKEQDSPGKRAVGRPPKRAAAPSPMSAVLGKRNREPAETETMGSKQTKKRSRR